ncbi:MAG: HD domain-containing protein [Candidatus Portnoybacteria bacterium]|nr:HD domain-containing protein [Candidatus Portnoybacteria bacterium]
MKILLAKIEQIARLKLKSGLSCHDWDHVSRVCNLAIWLGKKEKADLSILMAAALLHDIKKKEEVKSKGKICHAIEGAKEAERILRKLKLEDYFISRVKHCIEAHRYRNDIKPQTIEAKVLSDADKIDALGAVGIGRSMLFAGKVGARLHNSDVRDITATNGYGQDDTFYREFMVKLRYLKDKMHTRIGKKIALERTKYMERFLDRLEKEISAKL